MGCGGKPHAVGPEMTAVLGPDGVGASWAGLPVPPSLLWAGRKAGSVQQEYGVSELIDQNSEQQ